MKSIQKNQAGFTLIELVVVIVILGILAATALPKFIDLSSDASQAAVDGVAGAASSASSINYGARKAKSTNGVAVTTCADVPGLMQGGALPTGYTMDDGTAAVAANATVSCKINGQNSKFANASIVGIL